MSQYPPDETTVSRTFAAVDRCNERLAEAAGAACGNSVEVRPFQLEPDGAV